MVGTDYVIRMIEQLAAFLWAIVFNKKMKYYDAALEKIEEAYNGLLHTDGEKIKHLEINEIFQMNRYDNMLDKENIEVIAHLLFEEADITERINGPNNLSSDYYQKSFILFLMLIEGNINHKYRANIDEIIVKFENYVLDNKTNYELFKYFELKGLYGKAEDVLFELRENSYSNISDEIKTFYTRLLKKDDAELKNGNLPREEIIKEMTEL